MNTLKAENIKNFNIYISFHPNDERTFNAIVNNLDDTINELFANNNSREYISLTEKEVIYKIKIPIINSNDEMNLFFESLRELFNVTSSLCPHFTQYHESNI